MLPSPNPSAPASEVWGLQPQALLSAACFAPRHPARLCRERGLQLSRPLLPARSLGLGFHLVSSAPPRAGLCRAVSPGIWFPSPAPSCRGSSRGGEQPPPSLQGGSRGAVGTRGAGAGGSVQMGSGPFISPLLRWGAATFWQAPGVVPAWQSLPCPIPACRAAPRPPPRAAPAVLALKPAHSSPSPSPRGSAPPLPWAEPPRGLQTTSRCETCPVPAASLPRRRIPAVC